MDSISYKKIYSISYTKMDSIKYKHKYLNYKNKYLQLKNQYGGSSCFGFGCVSNATINTTDDFNALIPGYKIYREKPKKVDLYEDEIDIINLDDGNINIREKPDIDNSSSNSSSNSFIDFITGKRNNTILTDPNSISPFECKNKTELKKYEINKKIGFDVAKTNSLENEMNLKADLQCNIDFIKIIASKFERKIYPSKQPGKLKNNVTISIADQEHFIEAFNNINYIYTHIREHTPEHNKLKLEESDSQILNYFQNNDVDHFTQRQIIMINKKNPISRFITRKYNNINNIIASFEEYIDYGNSHYLFRGRDRFTE